MPDNDKTTVPAVKQSGFGPKCDRPVPKQDAPAKKPAKKETK